MMNPRDEPERRTPFPGPNAPHRPHQPYKFSPDELRVLGECNKESFYGRCLPFATVLGGLTYYGIQTGFLKRSRTFGAVPKVSVAVVVGYFFGKFSYHQKCAEKFMALPDSKIGRVLRSRKLGIPDEEVDPSIGSSLMSPFGGLTDSYSDVPDSNKSYDYENRPAPEGLDDSFRPSVDNPIILHEEEMPPEQKHVTTYEELRKKNREEYEQRRLDNYKQLQARVAPNSPPPQAEFTDDYKAPPLSDKNKYGDIWG